MMPTIPAMIGRARLQHAATGLRIILPAFWQDRFFVAVVLRPITAGFAVWCLWQIYPGTMFAATLTFFIVAIIVVQLAWRAFGREIVTVDKTALTLRIEITGFGWTRLYALASVSGLGFGEIRTRMKTYGYGFLYFDYDSERPWIERMLSIMAALFFFYGYDPRKPRFAKGLTGAEGRGLMQAMVEYAGTDLRSQRLNARGLAETLP